MALLWDGEDLRFYLDGKARPDRDIAGQRYQQQPQDEEQKLRDIVTKGDLQKSLLGAFYDLNEGAGGFFRGIIDDVRI